MHDEKALVNI